MKKFLKKNKYTVIVLVAFIIVVILLAQVVNLFFSSKGAAAYGNRLDGIEKVKIFDFNPLIKYAKIAINSDNVIYCDLLNDELELGSDFYVSYGFKLPEFSADNISKLEIFVYDNSDESKCIPLLTFSSHDEIDYFLSHYEEYISN